MIDDAENIGPHIVIITPKGTKDEAEKLAEDLKKQDVIASYEIIEDDV